MNLLERLRYRRRPEIEQRGYDYAAGVLLSRGQAAVESLLALRTTPASEFEVGVARAHLDFIARLVVEDVHVANLRDAALKCADLTDWTQGRDRLESSGTTRVWIRMTNPNGGVATMTGPESMEPLFDLLMAARPSRVLPMIEALNARMQRK